MTPMLRSGRLFPIIAILVVSMIPACLENNDPTKDEADAILESYAGVQRIARPAGDTRLAAVEVRVASNQGGVRVLNVAADLNADGKIARYETPIGQQEEWLVQNLGLPVRRGEVSTYTQLLDDLATTAKVRVMLTDEPIDEGTPWDGAPADGAESFEQAVTLGVLLQEAIASPAPGHIGGGGSTRERPQRSGTLDEFPAPKDEMDDVSLKRSGMPDLQQGPNSCVLHSLANSISWLARKHGFSDRFPNAKNGGQYDVGTAEGVNDLAYDLNELGEMGWSAERGTPPGLVLEGKRKFAAQKMLPIETTAQDFPNGQGSFDAIKQALRDGCDVEIVMSFPDIEMSHMVTVVGYVDRPGSKPGTRVRGLMVHDPATETEDDLYRLNADASGLKNFPFEAAARDPRILRIYKECYKAPQQTSFLGVSPDEVSFAHVPGEDDCPQTAAALTLTNNGNELAYWSLATPSGVPLDIDPSAGELDPQGETSVNVIYNCGGGGGPQPVDAAVLLRVGTASGTTVERTIQITGEVREATRMALTADLTPLTGATIGRTTLIYHPVPLTARIIRARLFDEATGEYPATGPDQPFPNHTWWVIEEGRNLQTGYYGITWRYERLSLEEIPSPAKRWTYEVVFVDE